MHCPQCGQQQVVDEMRFCSRCGFPLSVVTEVLSHGGTLPEREAEAAAPKLTSRQRGKRLAVILLLTGILLAMIGGIIKDPGNANPLDIGLARNPPSVRPRHHLCGGRVCPFTLCTVT